MIVAAYGATAHISTMYYHTSSATTFQCVTSITVSNFSIPPMEALAE